jgi:hypothetical protein
MHALSESQFFAAIESLPFSIERLSEDTVRVELRKPRSTRDITLDTLNSLRFEHCYLIGREACPPLAERNNPETSPMASALAEHRYLRLDTSDELRAAVTLLQQLGWCVDNDAYILDSTARWLVYVSHHDTISLDESGPGAGP